MEISKLKEINIHGVYYFGGENTYKDFKNTTLPTKAEGEECPSRPKRDKDTTKLKKIITTKKMRNIFIRQHK